MTEEEAALDRLAVAIADGAVVDWNAVESGADGSLREIVRELKVISAVAAAHGGDACRDGADAAGRADASGSWGPLRIVEKIGQGSYGTVFRAWDPRLDREVALKLVPASRGSSDRRAPSIIEEGRLLARVRHPNVVTVYGAGQVGHDVGLWMELVRGRTLEQLLRNGVRFSADEVIHIGVELCRAAAAVHAAGLLHRDINAHNVMRAEDGRIVLMDFGAGGDAGRGAPAGLVGTPVYLAPEVFFGETATPRSDVYSIGVLLYHLLTRAYPVDARSAADMRRAHAAAASAGGRVNDPAVPARLARVLQRALDPRLDQRYADAGALAADLTALERRPWRSVAMHAALTVIVTGLVTALAFTRSDPSLAVLPFDRLGQDADSEPFTQGLTNEILRSLSRIERLDLRGSTSPAAFRNTHRNPVEIGQQLDVDYVVEGSTLLAGNTVRVHARLIRVAGNTIVWSETFEREASETLEVLDGISSAIVTALRLKLARAPRREPHRSVTYQYLLARGLREIRNAQNAARAVHLLEAVVAKDPDFAPAWASLASALADATRHVSPREEMPALDPRMEPAARHALRLDETLAEAHAAMGSVHARQRDWTRARRSFTTALHLNPALTATHTDYALSTLMPMGRLDEALELLEEARRKDPRSLDVARVLALAQVESGRYEEAAQTARWVLARDPEFPFAGIWLARALIFAGRPQEALPILENREEDWGYLGYLYAVTGRRDEAETLAASHPESPGRQMLVYGGLGDRERAFDALERMAALNWWRAATWMTRPEVAILRGDPRVAELRRRLGLPPLER